MRSARWLDEHNAEEYLRSENRLEAAGRIRIEALAGGVSNQVLYVTFLDDPTKDFVLKQARPQLRTPQPWFASVERIWREVDVLRVCQDVLQRETHVAVPASQCRQIQTPRILFEDRENYLFAMTAAPREHVVWKKQLLAGEADQQIAAQCGRLLAALHSGTWARADVAAKLGDRQLFDELRLDPYYRTVAKLDAEAQQLMQRLIDSVWRHPRSLVHADFSPKNLLVYPAGLMMVDFETGHYGDPAFDLGFFLSHLVLKAVYHAPDHERYLALTERFWKSYAAEMTLRIERHEYDDLVARGIQNFAGCAWARIDGKSQVEYLAGSPRREAVRQFCRELLRDPPAAWPTVIDRVGEVMRGF
jgi:5-methylthioribose kinase